MPSHDSLHNYFCRVWYIEPLFADHLFLISTFLNFNPLVFAHRCFCRLPTPPMSTPEALLFCKLQSNVSLMCHVPADSILVSLNFYRHNNLPKLFELACQTFFVDAFVQIVLYIFPQHISHQPQCLFKCLMHILFCTFFCNIFLISHRFWKEYLTILSLMMSSLICVAFCSSYMSLMMSLLIYVGFPSSYMSLMMSSLII